MSYLLRRVGTPAATQGTTALASVSAASASMLPAAAALPPVAPEQLLADALKTLIEDRSILSDGGTLAFPCFHLYTNTQVTVPPGGKRKAAPVDTADPLPAAAIACLKGRDATIAKA